MANQDEDYAEGKLYQLSYYLYGLILISLYFLFTNILFIVTMFLALISIQEQLFTLPFILLAIAVSLIPMGPAWAAVLFTAKNILKKQFYSISKDFFTAYKRFFKKSISVWVILLSAILIIMLNYWAILSYEMFNVLIYILFACVMIITFVSIFVFPLLIEYSLSVKQLLNLALYFSFKKIFLSILLLLILLATLYLLLSLPIIFFLIAPGGYALILYSLCKKMFQKVQAEKHT